MLVSTKTHAKLWDTIGALLKGSTVCIYIYMTLALLTAREMFLGSDVVVDAGTSLVCDAGNKWENRVICCLTEC